MIKIYRTDAKGQPYYEDGNNIYLMVHSILSIRQENDILEILIHGAGAYFTTTPLTEIIDMINTGKQK